MKVFYQIHCNSGSFANPYPDEYETGTIDDAKVDLQSYFNHPYIEGEFTCLVFFGNPEGDYPCDTYPDMVLELGPRGGIKSFRT